MAQKVYIICSKVKHSLFNIDLNGISFVWFCFSLCPGQGENEALALSLTKIRLFQRDKLKHLIVSGNNQKKKYEARQIYKTSLVAQMVKRLPTMRETRVQSLGQDDPLEKEMATHSSTLAWKIPWMEEPGGLQSTGSQRVGHD